MDKNIKDAEGNQGDTEVLELKVARAKFLATIGQKKEALEAYEAAMEETVGKAPKIDLMFNILHVCLASMDFVAIKKNLERARSMIEQGGDWERRNRLKVYNATYFMMTRDFKSAAELLLESVATFTSYELFGFHSLVFYTVVTTVVSLDRTVLRNKVTKAPEILSVLHEIPYLEPFVFSIYKCKYADFFEALVHVVDLIKKDPYLAPHYNFLFRELRIVAYTQFLEAYKSVTLENMAKTFGFSVQFLDQELSSFVSSGRLNCKIDKVNGIIETNRPDSKNSQYQATIKQGDILLNRIQKLSKVISY